MAIDIAVFHDLDAVAADASGALDREYQPRLFDRLSWHRLLTRHCDIGGAPLIIRARNANGTTWLFLSCDGYQATALASWYTLETGLVASGKPDPALIEALATYLLRNLRIQTITLSPVSDGQLALIGKAFQTAGWMARSSRTTANWRTAPPLNWEAYLAQRPQRLQNTLKRKMKNSNLYIDIKHIFSEDIWHVYEQVYRSSWKPEEGSPAFLRALAAQEGDAGTLRLGLALDGDQPVAAQFWLVENGVATIHKLAHVESRREQSPGTILTAAMFRHVISVDRVREIDFGTGDEPYKADWMDQRRPLHQLSLFNPRSVKGLLGAARESLSGARARIRRA